VSLHSIAPARKSMRVCRLCAFLSFWGMFHWCRPLHALLITDAIFLACGRNSEPMVWAVEVRLDGMLNRGDPLHQNISLGDLRISRDLDDQRT